MGREEGRRGHTGTAQGVGRVAQELREPIVGAAGIARRPAHHRAAILELFPLTSMWPRVGGQLAESRGTGSGAGPQAPE